MIVLLLLLFVLIVQHLFFLYNLFPQKLQNLQDLQVYLNENEDLDPLMLLQELLLNWGPQKVVYQRLQNPCNGCCDKDLGFFRGMVFAATQRFLRVA
jgi:hypothetical protein